MRALADVVRRDRRRAARRGPADGCRALADPDLRRVGAAVAADLRRSPRPRCSRRPPGRSACCPARSGGRPTPSLVRAALAALEASDDAARLRDRGARLAARAGGRHRAAPRRPGGGRSPCARCRPDVRARLGAEAQRWIVRHPGLVQHAVNGGGGLLTGLSPLPVLVPDNRAATALLAAAYDDGTAVTTRRPDLDAPAGRRQPDSVEAPGRPPVGGGRPVARPGLGRQRHHRGAVARPGHRPRAPRRLPPRHRRPAHPAVDPGRRRPRPRHRPALGGGPGRRPTSTASSTRCTRPGSAPHEPVLLVGHSLGGMEAAALASRDTGFAITDVVTAGSPTAQVDGFPDGVHVLSLEHHGDVVPLLDGADNPRHRRADHGHLRRRRPRPRSWAKHGYGHYLAGARRGRRLEPTRRWPSTWPACTSAASSATGAART